jgi:hypothetical protein
MNSRLKKILLIVSAVALMVGVSRIQSSLNVDRDRLGLTRIAPLENAPPVLAFTTVALGGFRGLISNALWIRASELEEEDKYFESAQLANWITRLEPHFVHVWLVQSWNMAYNISVKFKDFPDRWRWVKRGIELLRDDGLRFNPNEMLIYRELAWFFQHKMGQNLDDANMYYKQAWANEMAVVFGKKEPNLDELIDPKTPDQQQRAQWLTNIYKLDPVFMKEVNERYGPLEWRLPEAHAIYWGAKGLDAAKKNPSKIKKDDLITLHRIIYQDMLLSFQRGRMIANPFIKSFEFGPNLDIIPKVSAAYEEAAQEDPDFHDHILSAHRNFLRDAVYFLYENNRLADAKSWYKYLTDKYPNKTVLDNKPGSLPATLSYEEYSIARILEDINETSHDRVVAAIQGLITRSYLDLAIDQDEHAAGLKQLARKIWGAYQAKIPQERLAPIGLPPFENMDREMLGRLLDVQDGAPAEVRAVLRTKLRMPPETAASTAAKSAAPGTNAPPAKVPATP